MPKFTIDTDLGTISMVKADGTEVPVDLPVDDSATEGSDPLGGDDSLGYGEDDMGASMPEKKETPADEAAESPALQAKEKADGTEMHESGWPMKGGGASPFGKPKPKTWKF